MPVADPVEARHDLPKANRVAVLASRVPTAMVALVCGIGIGLLVVAGILQRLTFNGWGLANLDTEASIATFFSATLLWATALWWLLVAATVRPRAAAYWAWSAVLAWVALDEGSAIHEKLERWSGTDWELLYVPIMAVGAVAWWWLFRRYRNQRRIATLLVAGAAAWIVVLVLELVQNWGGAPVRAEIYVPTMITEETLEMIGSTVFLVAGMLVLQRAVRAAEGTGE